MFCETLEAPQPWRGGGCLASSASPTELLPHRQNLIVPWGQWGLGALPLL